MEAMVARTTFANSPFKNRKWYKQTVRLQIPLLKIGKWYKQTVRLQIQQKL